MSKLVHRIALPGDGRSMWYDREGNFSPINKTLEMMPMPYDGERQALQENGTWLSSTEDVSLLDVWFPDGLLEELKQLGFVHRTFEVQHWIEKPNEIVFNIETAKEVEFVNR